ncbi:MAG: hypothetical protein HC838_17980, partial [Spirulinaceae cyanobacterium RM2_2_10]|nr:hypothetical protein [Spirulinaceae cyanobacterium RM2_2_10]
MNYLAGGLLVHMGDIVLRHLTPLPLANLCQYFLSTVSVYVLLCANRTAYMKGIEMPSWEQVLLKLSNNVEHHFDQLEKRLTSRLHRHPIIIQTYLGYGNGEMIRLRGRVLHDNGIRASDDRDTFWQNLLNTYRRLNTHEVPHAALRVSRLDQEVTVTTDGEGYFDLQLPTPDHLAQSDRTHPVQVQLSLLSAPNHPASATE